MTLIRNIFALVVMAAALGAVVMQIVYFPTNRGAQVMTGPAAVAFGVYLYLFLDTNSAAIARHRAKLRRMQPDQVKRFFALSFMWALMLSFLVYAIVTQVF